MVCEGVAEICIVFLEIGPVSMRRRFKLFSISMRGVRTIFYAFPLQQYSATNKWLISLGMENGCKKDQFCNNIPNFAMTN